MLRYVVPDTIVYHDLSKMISSYQKILSAFFAMILVPGMTCHPLWCPVLQIDEYQSLNKKIANLALKYNNKTLISVGGRNFSVCDVLQEISLERKFGDQWQNVDNKEIREQINEFIKRFIFRKLISSSIRVPRNQIESFKRQVMERFGCAEIEADFITQQNQVQQVINNIRTDRKELSFYKTMLANPNLGSIIFSQDKEPTLLLDVVNLVFQDHHKGEQFFSNLCYENDIEQQKQLIDNNASVSNNRLLQDFPTFYYPVLKTGAENKVHKLYSPDGQIHLLFIKKRRSAADAELYTTYIYYDMVTSSQDKTMESISDDTVNKSNWIKRSVTLKNTDNFAIIKRVTSIDFDPNDYAVHTHFTLPISDNMVRNVFLAEKRSATPEEALQAYQKRVKISFLGQFDTAEFMKSFVLQAIILEEAKQELYQDVDCYQVISEYVTPTDSKQ